MIIEAWREVYDNVDLNVGEKDMLGGKANEFMEMETRGDECEYRYLNGKNNTGEVSC